MNWGVVERTKIPKFRNGSKGDSNPVSLDPESTFTFEKVLSRHYIGKERFALGISYGLVLRRPVIYVHFKLSRPG